MESRTFWKDMAETTVSAASTTMGRWVMEEGVTFIKSDKKRMAALEMALPL